MARLTARQRKGRPDSDFAIPAKKPGPGSYPMWTSDLARKALQLSGGKPEQARVRAAVCKRWPQLDVCQRRAG